MSGSGQGPSLVVETAHARHPGGRSEQQDDLAVFTSSDSQCCLAVLADGMGGHTGGQAASRTVVETATAFWQRCSGVPAEPDAFLVELGRAADQAIERRGRELGVKPRTTLVALLIQDGHAFWLHAGDSRLYIFRRGKCVQRTRDHSVVEQMIRAGELQAEDAAAHPDQNLLLRCLGAGEAGGPNVTPGGMALRPGDGFVLCSDGFWGAVAEREMAALADTPVLSRGATQWCVTAAERNGAGGDNVSVAVVRTGRPSGEGGTVAPLAVTASALVLAAGLAGAWLYFV